MLYVKDTVAKQDENDEIDAVRHSTVNSALWLDGVKHHFVPVFARQYLKRNTLFSCNANGNGNGKCEL